MQTLALVAHLDSEPRKWFALPAHIPAYVGGQRPSTFVSQYRCCDPCKIQGKAPEKVRPSSPIHLPGCHKRIIAKICMFLCAS